MFGGKTRGTVEDMKQSIFKQIFTAEQFSFFEQWYDNGYKNYYDNQLLPYIRDYLDPHNCIGSCETPYYGCQACTNPDYFNCTKDNKKVCIHPDLKCNDHPDCDNAEDENLDLCYYKKIEKGTIDEYATLRCQSKMHKIMETVAAVCDGIIECQDEDGKPKDEPKNCKDRPTKKILISSVVFILFCYLGLTAYFKINRKYKNESKDRKLEFMKTMDSLEGEFMLRIIESPETVISDLREKFNMYGLHVHHHYGKKTKRKVGLKIYLEESSEKNAEADIFLQLKNNYHPEIANFVIESRFPGLIARFLPFIEDVNDFLSHFEKLHSFLHWSKKCIKLASHYADSIKDGFILYIMIDLNGGWESLVNYPWKFSSVTIMCMATSLLGPLLISGLQLAINNPGLIFNSERKDKLSVALMRVGNLVLSPLISIFLNVAKESIEERIREKSKNSEGTSQLNKLMEKKKQIKVELANHTSVDLGTELITQISLQLLLLFLNGTKTKTTGGLEVLFEQTEAWGIPGKTIIILTTLWSFKSCILLQRKIIQTEKGFLPFTSQIVVVFWSTMAAGRRIMAIIVWFLPSLGLFNILTHWKAEQIPIAVRTEAFQKNIMTAEDIIELNDMRRNVTWTDIDRWGYNSSNPEDNGPPHYSQYTGLALGESFGVFLALLALHMFTIAVVKVLNMKNFKKERLFDVFIKIIENLNFPYPHIDWDVEKQSTVDEYKQKLEEVNTEMRWSFGFNIFFHVLMFMPFWWTGICTCTF